LPACPKHSATYDLIIKGGRVIDPSMGLDATRDVAISGGRIAAVEASLAADAAGSGEDAGDGPNPLRPFGEKACEGKTSRNGSDNN
jgi:hypothetical protein